MEIGFNQIEKIEMLLVTWLASWGSTLANNCLAMVILILSFVPPSVGVSGARSRADKEWSDVSGPSLALFLDDQDLLVTFNDLLRTFGIVEGFLYGQDFLSQESGTTCYVATLVFPHITKTMEHELFARHADAAKLDRILVSVMWSYSQELML